LAFGAKALERSDMVFGSVTDELVDGGFLGIEFEGGGESVGFLGTDAGDIQKR